MQPHKTSYQNLGLRFISYLLVAAIYCIVAWAIVITLDLSRLPKLFRTLSGGDWGPWLAHRSIFLPYYLSSFLVSVLFSWIGRWFKPWEVATVLMGAYLIERVSSAVALGTGTFWNEPRNLLCWFATLDTMLWCIWTWFINLGALIFFGRAPPASPSPRDAAE